MPGGPPIPESGQTVEKVTQESIGLHAQFDQLEAGLEEAHRTLDRMIGVSDTAQPKEAQAGGEASASRCSSTLSDLNTRLNDLAGRVGRL